MKQVIYVDELLFINTVVNYFLLLTTSLILKTQVNKFRILLGAFVGGLFSFTVFLPPLILPLSLLLRAFVAFILVLITFGFKTFSYYIKHFFTLFISTALFAGLLSGLWLTFKANSAVCVNSAVYFDINIFVLIISSAICYIIIYFFQKFFKKNLPKSFSYDIEVEAFGKSVRGKAMLDTGNRLTEAFSSFPVAVCTKRFCVDFFGDNVIEKIENFNFDDIDEKWKRNFRIVNCRTVSGSTTMAAFRPDNLKIKSNNICFSTDRVYIAVSQSKNYLNEKFDAVLPPALFEGAENE